MNLIKPCPECGSNDIQTKESTITNISQKGDNLDKGCLGMLSLIPFIGIPIAALGGGCLSLGSKKSSLDSQTTLTSYICRGCGKEYR